MGRGRVRKVEANGKVHDQGTKVRPSKDGFMDVLGEPERNVFNDNSKELLDYILNLEDLIDNMLLN